MHMNERFIASSKLANYVQRFNDWDTELYPQAIPNCDALAFLEANVPRFECPDPILEQTYYFRWWTYRKHIKETPDGAVITEFLPPVPWAGKHNTINCPAVCHYYEGRWIRDRRYLDDYSLFWLRKGGNPRSYSFCIADAFLARDNVAPSRALLVDLLPDLIANYEAWETGWTRHQHRFGLHANGLFYTIDDREGGEYSIGGHGYRPTLNSYMYGDAKAIAKIARMAGIQALAKRFEEKAAVIKALVQEYLWDADAHFFKILSVETNRLCNVRELYGYIPWFFNLPDPGKGYETAWRELMDPQGFFAPFGPTFAEQRHPKFRLNYTGHECQWNGPSWPLATSLVLTALANLLNHYDQSMISKSDYLRTLRIYAGCHAFRQIPPDGSSSIARVIDEERPWIDESLNPFNGDWMTRTALLLQGRNNIKERGKDYNHSTFCDLVISGLVGLRPRSDGVLEVNPLLPEDTWDHFCLENVAYRGQNLTILWDRDGQRYHRGPGLLLLADGAELARADRLTRITAQVGV